MRKEIMKIVRVIRLLGKCLWSKKVIVCEMRVKLVKIKIAK